MDKILDRIKKLLALAESSSPEEAQLAAERAAELMTKHSISEAEARGHDTSKIDIVEGRIDEMPDAPARRVISGWQAALAGAVAAANNGSVLNRACRDMSKRTTVGYKIIMFGQQEDIDVSRYLFMSLEKTLLHNVRRYLREVNGRGPEGNAYLHGQVMGIHLAFQHGREKALEGDPGSAIVLINDTAEKAKTVRDSQPGIRPAQYKTNILSNNFSDGMEDAKNINVSNRNAQGLTSGQSKLKGE